MSIWCCSRTEQEEEVFSCLNKAMVIKTQQECVFIWESLSSLLFLLATGTSCPFRNISLSLAGTASKHFSCEMWTESQRWMQLIVLGEAVTIITHFHFYCLCHCNKTVARAFLCSAIRGRLWSFRVEKMTSLSWEVRKQSLEKTVFCPFERHPFT